MSNQPKVTNMNATTALQLSEIENSIVRTNAMLESSKARGLADCVATFEQKLRELYAQKMGMVAPVAESYAALREHRVNSVERILEALDPDQSDNVSWWAQ